MQKKKNIKVLDLFAGSRSISKAAENLGYESFSIDKYISKDMSLVIDIKKVNRSMILKKFGIPDIIWASPVCLAWSKMGWFSHWDIDQYKKNKIFKPVTHLATESVEMIRKTIEIFSWFPGSIFYMENPEGLLYRHPVINYFSIYNLALNLRRIKITYCSYDNLIQKPTHIWTNNLSWTPKKPCKKSSSCHISSPRGSTRGIDKISNRVERSIIPEKLCLEVLSCCTPKNEIFNLILE